MRRAWMWGVLLALACTEKAPPEGAVRVAVSYGSYQPACVRVLARDVGKDQDEHTDIARDQLKNTREQMIRAAVFRKAEWGQTLTVEVSSFTDFKGGECAGTRVETVSQQVEVPLGDYATFAAILQATDADGDDSPALERSVTGLDCDDGREDVYPGAEERCSVAVDYDCDGAKGCQDGKCQQKACDDGNACTTGERCVGVGAAAQCQGQAKVCEKPAGLCVTGAACSQDTGECAPVRKSCPAPASVCLEAGVCNDGTGGCEYKARPASASCNDSQVCTTGDTCDGLGHCKGSASTCPVSSVCFRATSPCPEAGACGQVPEPNNVNIECALAGGGSGVCRYGDGACSRFPYVPSNFDPDALSPTGALTTTCAVTFNATSLAWSPATCIPNPPAPVSAPGAATVVFAVSGLNLGGDLRLVAGRPVLLAVYGNVTLDHALLANSEVGILGAGGNVGPGCDVRKGGGGGLSANAVGSGGGGAGGASVGGAGESGTSSSAGGGVGSAGGGTFAPPNVGCAGGAGGGVDAQGGEGGAGGGAVQLSVAGTLKVNNWVTASGAGGRGGRFSNANGGQVGGGGGGGSGGQVLLEAYRLEFTQEARLTANGGAGGEGSGYYSTAQANGADGEAGPRSTAAQAKGGSGLSIAGGEGGNGGSLDNPPGAGTKGNDAGVGAKGAGGGGGGAAGHIKLRSVKPCTFDPAAVVSPATNRDCPL